MAFGAREKGKCDVVGLWNEDVEDLRDVLVDGRRRRNLDGMVEMRVSRWVKRGLRVGRQLDVSAHILTLDELCVRTPFLNMKTQVEKGRQAA
jgi:hypothetical protein